MDFLGRKQLQSSSQTRGFPFRVFISVWKTEQSDQTGENVSPQPNIWSSVADEPKTNDHSASGGASDQICELTDCLHAFYVFLLRLSS